MTAPHPGVRTPRRETDRSTRTARLLREAAASVGESRHGLLHDVILLNVGVADTVARRYYNRGLEALDLQQTAREALVKAVHRFDPAQTEDLLSYAVPVIRGELQRHFRDRGWMVRPTRQIQELQWRSRGAATDLTQELGRTPTGDELARHLGVSRADYDRAQGAHGCFSPASLDQPLDSDATATVADTLGMVDTELSPLEARLVLGPALRRLQEEEQRIVHLRFFEELTQEEIGHEVGLSQPQVSRVLLRILSSLRTVLGEDLPQTA